MKALDVNQTRRALICGVSGQDGAYLAHTLINKGYIVFGTSRDSQITVFRNLLDLGVHDQVETVSMILTDFRSVFQVLKRTRPDEIYNLAGQSSVGLSFEQPVETLESVTLGTLNLLEAIRFLDWPVRLYNASSSECFGDTHGLPADEDTPFRPRSPYAVAKSAAFWTVANYREAYGLFACSGLLFNHESPLRPERFVTRKIVKTACKIAAGQDCILRLGNLFVHRDWGWAPEYVEAMWLMLQQEHPEDYVIATGATFSLENFIEEVFMSLGLDWSRYTETCSELLRATDIECSRANPAKAREQLGWKANYTMPDVVRMMVDFELNPQKMRFI